MWLELTFVRYVNNMCKGRGKCNTFNLGLIVVKVFKIKRLMRVRLVETTFLSGVNKVLRACSTGQTAVFGLLSGSI